MKRIHILSALLVVPAWLCFYIPASAQLELAAASHPFALSTATTTRLFGMGGFITCVKDVGFGNPAFCGTLTRDHVVGRYSSTDFSGGLKLKGQQVSIAVPLQDNYRGLQFTGFRLTSDAGLAQGLGPAPVLAGLNEYDVAVHYGQRVGRRWAFGVGLSPVFHTSVNISNPLNGTPLAHLEASSKQGYRLGGLYQLGPDSWLGAIYDKYHEDVTASGMLFSGSTVTGRLSSEEMAAGASHRFNQRVLGALEWQQLTTESTSARVGASGWRAGVEVTPTQNWALRLGDDEGALTAGLGYNDARWTANYAYLRNWNDDTVGQYFGSSNTHQFEVTYSW